MMLGLLGSAICNVLFGLSRKSLLWSIATRALCGAVNGNLAIARTVVGEVAEAHGVAKGRAFSIFGFCHAAGWMRKFIIRIQTEHELTYVLQWDPLSEALLLIPPIGFIFLDLPAFSRRTPGYCRACLVLCSIQ